MIGQVGGIGLGERVYAVRFIEELAYVVTFRQVDPLHVIDLSDPAHPAVRGELHIPGYSAYLHPIGEGLLMGVGQDATDDGACWERRYPCSTCPIRPTRYGCTTTASASWSQAEWDLTPSSTTRSEPAAPSVRNLDLGRGDGDLELLERRRRARRRPAGRRPAARSSTPASCIPSNRCRRSHLRRRRVAAFGRRGDPLSFRPRYPTPIQRSLVLGALATLSEAGLKATSLDTFEDTAWVEFPIP